MSSQAREGWRLGSAVLLACSAGCAAPHVADEVGAAPAGAPAAAAPVAAETTAVATDEPATLAESAPARAPSPGSPYPTPDASPAAAADWAGVPVHGSLALRYRGREAGDANDHDASATLALDIGDPARHAFTGHFLARGWADLGGEGRTFSGLDDTFDDSLSGILYYGYVDAHGIDALEALRLGRQQLWETPAFLVFDGGLVEAGDRSKLSVGAYGGLRTQYYDTSAPSDVVVGVYGEGRPWEGGRVRLDYMYLEDEERLGNDQDDLLGLKLWQLVGEELTLEGGYTALEGEDRDLRLRALWVEADSDLTLQASFYKLLETQREQALELDPYFSSLMEYHPFEQLGLSATKGFADVLNLSLGLDLRELDEADQEGEFNHEFQRYYVSATFLDVLVDGLDLTLTGDVWDDDQQDVQTWAVDVSKQLDERFQGSLGSYYSLYKYDLFMESERDDVRTYYARLRYDRTESLSFDVELDYEDDEFEEYYTLRLGATWLF
jgi:hypothetical protein